MPLSMLVLIAVFGGIFFHAHNEVKKERREKVRSWARMFRKYVKGERSEIIDYGMIYTMIRSMEEYVGQSKKDFNERVRGWAKSMRDYLESKEHDECGNRMALSLADNMEWYADNI